MCKLSSFEHNETRIADEHFKKVISENFLRQQRTAAKNYNRLLTGSRDHETFIIAERNNFTLLSWRSFKKCTDFQNDVLSENVNKVFTSKEKNNYKFPQKPRDFTGEFYQWIIHNDEIGIQYRDARMVQYMQIN